MVPTPEFSCFGHQWILDIYPGGKADSLVGYVGINLANMSNTGIKVSHGYSVRDADGKEVVYWKPGTNKFGSGEGNAWHTDDFAKRSTLMELLVQGTLVIEVRMKLPSAGESITQFIPSNPINKNVLQKFMHEESADVVFEVDNESCQNGEEHTKKKSKTTTSFYAHRFILQDISTMLSELCKSDESGEGLLPYLFQMLSPRYSSICFTMHTAVNYQKMSLLIMQKISLTPVISTGWFI